MRGNYKQGHTYMAVCLRVHACEQGGQSVRGCREARWRWRRILSAARHGGKSENRGGGGMGDIEREAEVSLSSPSCGLSEMGGGGGGGGVSVKKLVRYKENDSQMSGWRGGEWKSINSFFFLSSRHFGIFNFPYALSISYVLTSFGLYFGKTFTKLTFKLKVWCI